MHKQVMMALFSFFAFFQSVIANNIDEQFFHEIFQNSQYCVKSYDEEKIFLKSENLHFTEEGLVLDLNGFDYIALPYILSGSNGSYIMRADRMLEVLNTCPLCGKKYFVRCRNPDCPSNKK